MSEPARLIKASDTLLPHELERIIRKSRIDKFHGDIVLKLRDGEIYSARIEQSVLFAK